MRSVPAPLLALGIAILLGPWTVLLVTDAWFTPIGDSDTAEWGDFVLTGITLPCIAVVLWAARPVVRSLDASSSMGGALRLIAIGLALWSSIGIVTTAHMLVVPGLEGFGGPVLALVLAATYATLVWGTIRIAMTASLGVVEHPGRWVAVRVGTVAPVVAVAAIALTSTVVGSGLEPVDYVFLVGDAVVVVAAYVAWRRLDSWRGGMLARPFTYLVVAAAAYLLGEVMLYSYLAGVAERVTYPAALFAQILAPGLIALMFLELRATLLPDASTSRA